MPYARKIAFRFELLRGGAYYARLRALESEPPRIRAGRDDRLKASFTGVFAPEAEDADGRPMPVNWLTDEIRPVMILDGAEHGLGVYIPTTPVVRDTGTVRSVAVEAYSRCQRLLDTNSTSLLYWPRGTFYLDAVGRLLEEAGVLSAIKTPTTASFSEPREDWPAGTPYLDIVNELLGEIGYEDLQFDQDGHALLRPASVPEPSAIRHLMDVSDSDTRLLPGYTREQDLFNAPNVFVVVCANPEKAGLMRAEAVNANPQSPLSVPRRGRRIVSVTTLNNVASQFALQAAADRLRNESLISGETLRVSTGLRPGFAPGDVVALHTGELTTLCVEQGYEMELRVGGRMTHELRKVVYNIE